MLEALRARRRDLQRLRLRSGAVRADQERLIAAAKAAGVPVEDVADGPAVELEAGPLPETGLDELLATAGASPRCLVALDGVEDPQNLGAIARAAEGAGVSGLILTRRRAPPLSPAVSRASAGAIEWLPVARVPNLARALEGLQERGFWVFGATAEGGEDLFALPDRVVRGDRVVLLGAEGRGLRDSSLKAVDHRVKIPMLGHVESLNVGAAAAVLLFELARRSKMATSP